MSHQTELPSSLEVTDQISKSVQKTPNRVSLDDINAAIAHEFYAKADDAFQVVAAGNARSMGVLTMCCIVMKNGFIVIGKSAPADPANYDPVVGRKFAREDAVRQLWPLMAFSLCDRLAVGQQ